MTLQLVAAVRQGSGSSPAAVKLGLEQLRMQLNQESSAAGRNRLFRRWLTQHGEAVVAAWEELGFPPAPAAEAEPVEAAAVAAAAEPAASAAAAPLPPTGGSHSRGSHFVGVAVFDFDQTITTRHVGVFEDLNQFCERSLGGADRLAMLRAMFAGLRERGVAVAVVTRNSRRLVKQALDRAGLLSFLVQGLLFGFEDYDDEVPKSYVLREKVLAALGLGEPALIFVDDDPSNIKDVKEHIAGAKLLHCPRQGLRQEDCDAILSWASCLA